MTRNTLKDGDPSDDGDDKSVKPQLSVEDEFDRNFEAALRPLGKESADVAAEPNQQQVPVDGEGVQSVQISEFPDRPTPIMPGRGPLPVQGQALPDEDDESASVTLPAPVDYNALELSSTASSSPLPPPPSRLNRISSIVPSGNSSAPPSSVPSSPPEMLPSVRQVLTQIRSVMDGTHPSLIPSPVPRGYGIPVVEPGVDETGPAIEIIDSGETEEDLLPAEVPADSDDYALPAPHSTDPVADSPFSPDEFPAPDAVPDEPDEEKLKADRLQELVRLVTQCSALFREKGIDLSFINSDALRFTWKNMPLDSMATAEVIHAVLVEIMDHLAKHLFENKVNVPQTKLGLFAGRLIHRIAFVDYESSTVDCDAVTLQHFTMLRTLLASHPVNEEIRPVAEAFIDSLDGSRLK